MQLPFSDYAVLLDILLFLFVGSSSQERLDLELLFLHDDTNVQLICIDTTNKQVNVRGSTYTL